MVPVEKDDRFVSFRFNRNNPGCGNARHAVLVKKLDRVVCGRMFAFRTRESANNVRIVNTDNIDKIHKPDIYME